MHRKRNTKGKRWSWFAPSVLLVLLSLLAGCGNGAASGRQKQPISASPPPWQSVTITAIDYGYAMPASFALRAGLVDVKLVNNGTQPHQAQLARLKPGVTNTQVINELIEKRQEAQAFSLLTFVGGPDTIAPGSGQETILALSAGNYALLCLVTGSDGLPHIDKGMIHFLSVAPAQETETIPQSSGELIMQDHGYVLPAVLTQSHASTLRVENQGTQPHELNIVRLANGKSAQDILTFFQNPSGPPPFEEDGGMATLAPGTSCWMSVHLEPGHYAAFSAVPDPKTGVFQLTQGLLTSFTVQ
jgi:outer membrane protein assembly factor BamE (lipoprotein component of BamABCDE complex)